MIEFYTGGGFVSFDGRVVEVWMPRKMAVKRLHVAVIADIRIERRRNDCWLDIMPFYGAGNMLVDFTPDDLPFVEQLVTAVKSAMTAYPGGRRG